MLTSSCEPARGQSSRHIEHRHGQCSMSTAENMRKLDVDKKATDMGPSGAHGEHWYADLSIKILSLVNVNDWIVDTALNMAITNWTSNASAPPAGAEGTSELSDVLALLDAERDAPRREPVPERGVARRALRGARPLTARHHGRLRARQA